MTLAGARCLNNSTFSSHVHILVYMQLKIWDTMGQERYARNMMPMYYRGAEAAILVYDITSVSSFHSLTRWLRDIKEYREVDDIVMAVVGNKADCASDREVSTRQGEEFAEKNKMMFMETSAKTGQNVEELFCAIARKLRSLGRERARDDITVDLHSRTNSSLPTVQQSSRCCAFGADPDYSLPDSPQLQRKLQRQTSSPSATGSSKSSQTPTKSSEPRSKQDALHARSPARSLSYAEAKSSANQTRGKRKSKQLSESHCAYIQQFIGSNTLCTTILTFLLSIINVQTSVCVQSCEAFNCFIFQKFLFSGETFVNFNSV